MWRMFDDMIECDECGGVLGAPPKFTIPPPPRPPSLGEYSGAANCNEEEMALKAQQAWDSDMCEAIPILDASLYSSQSLQTSAMIAVFSLLLVLVVLISSLFVWKNKRKVQNFLPCKTPTRGPHLNGGLPLGSGHSVTYEDPDAHLGHHRPLVMRHHHNVEMLHGKSIHYPSGYPMTRSPPFLVSSSPGPDPYRSNDNVYEELGPSRDSDGESEPPLHSDDDFAEDELSLPGERSFNKAPGGAGDLPPPLSTVSTIYHERATPSTAGAGPSGSGHAGPERNSVLSSSSSTQDASTATTASSASSHNNNSHPSGVVGGAAVGGGTRSGPGGLLAGMLRHTTARSKFHTTNGARAKAERRGAAAANAAANAAASVDDFNTSTSTAETASASAAPEMGIGPLQQLYDNRSNLMSLAYVPHQQPHQAQSQHGHGHAHHQPPPHSAYHHSLHHIHHGAAGNNNNSGAGGGHHSRSTAPQFYNTLESEVDRRNRINAQLSHVPQVATIFRERIHYPGSGRYPQPYYASNSAGGLLANSMRSRSSSRSMDRRHRIAAPLDPIEPAYGYSEPVYRENYHYDTCGTPGSATLHHHHHQQQQQRLGQPLAAYPAFIVPDYTTGGRGGHGHSHPHPSAAATYQNQHHPGQSATHLYARGDSSFGSDSGYSHHTPASSIGRHDYEAALPPAPPAPKTPSKLAAALNFGWNRRKSTPNAGALNVQHTTAAAVAAAAAASSGGDATSPNNNNSASSTITSTLENGSSTSSGSATSGSAAMAAAASPAPACPAHNNNATTSA